MFNPHCSHCMTVRQVELEEQMRLREEGEYCRSCETYGRENDRLVRENERLLDLLLDKPAQVEKTIDTRDLKPIQTSRSPFMPSAVRRQMLERESRHNLQLAKDAPKPDAVKVDVELQELEAELDNVRQAREEKVSN